jgi:hypothetical protein
VRPSWRPELLLALTVVWVQGLTGKVEYGVRVVRAGPGGRQVVATGAVSGPTETALRLALHGESVEIEGLFSVDPGPDSSVTLIGDFTTRRRVGRSGRGLPLWERDGYRRTHQLFWGDTARLYPTGVPRAGAAESLWVDVAVLRRPAGAQTRPTSSVNAFDSELEIALEAVMRPRRAVVWLTLVRGDTASAPRRMDLALGGGSRVMELPVGLAQKRSLEFSLVRPEPARVERERTLAMDADMVCLRVGDPGASVAQKSVCGRLNNVVYRLSLDDGDTLVASFAWPVAR